MKQEICIAAFYKFVPFPDYRTWREPLLLICRAAGIRGTILLAEERHQRHHRRRTRRYRPRAQLPAE